MLIRPFTLTLELSYIYCLMASLCLQNIGLNSLNAFQTLLNLLDILISDYILYRSSPSTYFPSLSSKPPPPWRGFPRSSIGKNPLAMQETRVWFLGWEDSLEKEMATHFSILAWRIPWTEEPDRLQSMGSQGVRHDWVTNTLNHWVTREALICYSAIEKNEIMPCAATWMELESAKWVRERQYAYNITYT